MGVEGGCVEAGEVIGSGSGGDGKRRRVWGERNVAPRCKEQRWW